MLVYLDSYSVKNPCLFAKFKSLTRKSFFYANREIEYLFVNLVGHLESFQLEDIQKFAQSVDKMGKYGKQLCTHLRQSLCQKRPAKTGYRLRTRNWKAYFARGSGSTE